MKIDSYHHRRLFWLVSQIDLQRIVLGFLLEGHIYEYTTICAEQYHLLAADTSSLA